MMNFQFLMPDVEGYGVWQMDTGSYHGITGIYDSLAYLKLFGDVAGVPLRLTLEPKEVSPDGRKKTVHVLRLTHAGKLADMLQAVERPRWALSAAVMPEPDETPDDLMLAARRLRAGRRGAPRRLRRRFQRRPNAEGRRRRACYPAGG